LRDCHYAPRRKRLYHPAFGGWCRDWYSAMLRTNPVLALAAFLLVVAGSPDFSRADGTRQLSVVTVNGESRVTIGDSLIGSQALEYRLGIGPRQHVIMMLEGDGASAAFTLTAPGQGSAFFDSAIHGNHFEGDLAEAGTYTIRVYLQDEAARRNEPVDFTLKGEIRPTAP
jgi:hypothetical protein